MKTFDIYFNDENDSNNKGMRESLEYCKEYIRENNGTNNSKPDPAPIIDLVTEWFAKFFEFIRSVFASIGIIF